MATQIMPQGSFTLPFPPPEVTAVLARYSETVCPQATPFTARELKRVEDALSRGRTVDVKAKHVVGGTEMCGRIISVDSSHHLRTGWVGFCARIGSSKKEGVIHASTGLVIMGWMEVPSVS